MATLFTCLPKFFFPWLMLFHLSILNQIKISIVSGLTFNVEFEHQTHGFSRVHLTFVVSIVFFKNRFYFQYPFIWESFDFYSMVWSERVFSRTQNYRMTSFANPWDLEQEKKYCKRVKICKRLKLEWNISRNFAKCKKWFCENIFAKNECKNSRKW